MGWDSGSGSADVGGSIENAIDSQCTFGAGPGWAISRFGITAA